MGSPVRRFFVARGEGGGSGNGEAWEAWGGYVEGRTECAIGMGLLRAKHS